MMTNITISNQEDAIKLKQLVLKGTSFNLINVRPSASIIIFPENIKCKTFKAEYQHNLVLPENLQCDNLQISFSTLVNTVPLSLSVLCNMVAMSIENLVLPTNFKVGSLIIPNNKNIKLPENLYINGFLNIVNNDIKEIPPGTYIEKGIIYNSYVKNIGQYDSTSNINYTDVLMINGYIIESTFEIPDIMRK